MNQKYHCPKTKTKGYYESMRRQTNLYYEV